VADAARRLSLPRTRRLRRPAEFAAVLAAERAGAWRHTGRWLAMTAAALPPAVGAPSTARLGLTVGKRLARRAVDRNLVKRVIREAFRHAEPPALAISVRLRRPLPSLPRGELARALRVDADALFGALAAYAAPAEPVR
jgi:ribonuclease P protein component